MHALAHRRSRRPTLARDRVESGYGYLGHSPQVRYLLARQRIQAKMIIGSPNDKYEQEADQVANQVMRMPEPQLQRACTCSGGCPKCQTKQTHELLQSEHVGTSASEQTTAPPNVQQVLRSPGQPLDPATRAYFDSRFHVNLDRVRVHTGESGERAARSVQAQAFTVGNNIVFGKDKYAPGNDDGKRLIAHELAHVLSPTHEGLMRKVTPDYKQIDDALTYNLFDWVVTDANIQSVLNILAGLNATDLADTLAKMRTDGYVEVLLENITNAKLIVFLQQVQRKGARAFATGQGLATQADMDQAQATFMQARNAASATAVHGPAPTQAQVAAQQSSQVASTSIPPQSATLSPADEATDNVAATTAVAAFVTWATANHPDLKLTASHLRVDSRAVFERGQNVLAFAGSGKAVVGKSFARAVNADPAYALSTVMHELRGHLQYGPSGSEYGLEVYDQASALMPGYTQPTGAGRRSEKDAYAYQETEIYSLMFELPFFTPVTAAHSSLSSLNFDPGPAISSRIGIIKNQFEPRVAQSLVRGLWMRLRLDPQLQPVGLKAFEKGVKNNFTAAEATAILQ